ncbi:hypothetical protein DT019_20730 [Streptomyces sp. SDr-06]|uniref:hypothetical protein n=1 Tax=Streptomyces sp. SDr-06 TaxID=2267702 RepID=UPI000DE95A7C|nr:hypothetical protein [Streptomyces sp. SDr-06]RCH66583.1 hypothetical protein DT019_20730 [Streptomyces sp. SDr-06]
MLEDQSLYDYLCGCSERADKVGFALVDGREFLGWIHEVTEDHLLLAWAPSPFYVQADDGEAWSPQEEWVAFAALVLESIASYDPSVPGRVHYLS